MSSASNFSPPHITYFSTCCCTEVFLVTPGWIEPIGSSLKDVPTRLTLSLIYGKGFPFPQIVVMCQRRNLEEVYFWKNP